MSDKSVNLMAIIESVANEMFEKFLLAKMEALVDAKINAYSRQVSAVKLDRMIDGTDLESRLNLAYKELENLQRAVGISSYEATGGMYQGSSVLSMLDNTAMASDFDRMGCDVAAHTAAIGELSKRINDLDERVYNGSDLARLTDRVDTLEDSVCTHDTVLEVVNDALDDIDWSERIGDNLDISDYMDEITENLDVTSAVDSYMEGLDFSDVLRDAGIDWDAILDDYMASVFSKRLSITYTHE